jgi:hypothetical protein
MKTTCWGVVQTKHDGHTFYAPTEFIIEDGKVVEAKAFNAGIYKALAYASLPDHIQSWYRAHLTHEAKGTAPASFPPEEPPTRQTRRPSAKADK